MTVQEQMEIAAAALRKNNIAAYCVDTKEQALSLVEGLLNKGDTVSVGGSRTLQDVGVIDLLRNGDYRFLDRAVPGLTPEQIRQVYLNTFDADAYLCSSNAVTLNGELYNVDGNANRVAAMTFGPRSVILVVGCNKLVKDLDEAAQRVKRIAAPMNTKRLDCATYCRETGVCVAADGEYCTEGCSSPARICCTYVTMGYQRNAGRIKVILVAEPLGF